MQAQHELTQAANVEKQYVPLGDARHVSNHKMVDVKALTREDVVNVIWATRFVDRFGFDCYIGENVTKEQVNEAVLLTQYHKVASAGRKTRGGPEYVVVINVAKLGRVVSEGRNPVRAFPMRLHFAKRTDKTGHVAWFDIFDSTDVVNAPKKYPKLKF